MEQRQDNQWAQNTPINQPVTQKIKIDKINWLKKCFC